MLSPRPQRTFSAKRFIIIIMSQQNRIRTEGVGQHLESALKAVVTQASRENLLPKIMWRADREFGSRKLIDYQKSIHRKYDNDLKTPLNGREKFREKVMKLVNNQLDVDYFEKVKMRDKTMVTYQGHQMEEEKVETKKQYEIFKNFNEKKFRETSSNLFDDQLEVEYPHLYHNRGFQEVQPLHILEAKPQADPIYLKTEKSQSTARTKPTQIDLEVPKSSRRKIEILESGRKKGALIQFKDRKQVGKELPINDRAAVERIIREVGGFTHLLRESSLCLTKESISRWLKQKYEKPARIVDFLELKEVVTFEEFWKISKRMRVMPHEHMLFMTFLYFDGNNDGYICDYDLERLSALSARRPLLAHDYRKLKQSNIKKILTKKAPYLDLYKRSEISETVYFEWKKLQQGDLSVSGIELQVKNRLLSSKQRHIFLDFSAFCAIFKLERPYLWYDLMHLFSGTTFLGLNYN